MPGNKQSLMPGNKQSLMPGNKTMRTVGEILSTKRKELGLSLDDIEEETKIRRKYLEAIEKNEFSRIAEGPIVKGFVRNYSLALGLSPENILAIFRRDFRENEKGQIVPRGMIEPLDEKNFWWTPKTTVVTATAILIATVIIFFTRQYLSFFSAPPLEISSPKEGQVSKEKVVVSGKTDKDATVKIDGALVSIAEDGSFKEEIVLPRGENVVTVESANRQDKKRVINIKIKVE